MEKILRKTLILLIYIGLILINTKVYAAQIAKPTNDNVRIREEASTNSGIVVNVSSNDEVTILSKEDNWYKVELKKGGKTYSGFIREDLLVVQDETVSSSAETTTTEKVEIKEGYIAKSKNELHTKILPTINSESVEVVKQGTEYKVIEVLNKWCYIETENQSGWILKSKLEESLAVEKKDLNEDESDEENTKESNNDEEKVNEEDLEKKDESKEKDKKSEDNKQSTSKEVKNETKYVTVETLNVREKADSSAKVIEQLDLNEKITVLEIIDNSWAKIVKNGKTGYVSVKFLSDKKTEITSRSGDTSRENQEVESNQTDVKEEESSSESQNIVDSQNNTNTSSSSSASGFSVVEFSKQYLGYKYVSGGSSPSTGFDCSGFTTYVFKHFGITLSRTSGAQASNGTKVEKDNLEPGDILIFNDSANSKVGHVGIYIGGNQFIHAANAKKGVIITSLSDSYYSARYVGARRVL